MGFFVLLKSQLKPSSLETIIFTLSIENNNWRTVMNKKDGLVLLKKRKVKFT